MTPNETIFKGGAFRPDPWQRRDAVDDGQQDRAILPLDVWRTVRARNEYRAGSTGVELVAEAVDDAELPLLARVALVVVRLPKFTDGRAYSLARRLRDTHGFSGELRAAGDVLLDQIALLERCGFDSFAITHAPTLRFLSASGASPPSLATAYQVTAEARTSEAERMPRIRPSLERRRRAG